MGLRFKRTESAVPEMWLVPFIDILLVLLILDRKSTRLNSSH